jgi:glycosyltransferase involved in cell wall biosynthesis
MTQQTEDERRHVALFVIHYPAYGGPHNRILRIAEPLRAAGWDCAVVLPTEPGNAVSWLRSGGVPVIERPLGRVRRMRSPWPNLQMLASAPGEIAGLRTVIREWDPDVVVVGNLVMPHAAIAAMLERRAVLWQIVDTAVPKLLQLIVMPLVRRLADAVAYGGAQLRHEHVAATRLPQPWYVIPPPVDTARFTASAKARIEVRSELNIGESDPVIGQVVAINPKKGLEYFLRAAAIIVRSRLDARFMILGSAHSTHTAYYHELRALQAQLGLSERQVLWLGDRADTERYYAAIDIFAVTSVPRSEGTTTTSMEALACEVPVVATDVGAISEVVADHECGYLVEPNNPTAFAGRVLTLLGDDRLRQELGASGRQRTMGQFDVKVCVERYVEAFEGALMHRANRRNLPRKEKVSL